MSRKKATRRALNGILLLDKPTGMSSNKVLQKVAALFDARKAGHTGSLDPLASGMLPICFGEATKMAHYLLSADKAYTVTAQFGVSTDSGDADGEITDQIPDVKIDSGQLSATLARFRGAIEQIPPMHSALKYRGQPLYKLARKGVTVERAPRTVRIDKLVVLSATDTQCQLYVECSKGTYIRSLVADIGAALGCGAHVVALRRNWVAPFSRCEMYTLEQLESHSGETSRKA